MPPRQANMKTSRLIILHNRITTNKFGDQWGLHYGYAQGSVEGVMRARSTIAQFLKNESTHTARERQRHRHDNTRGRLQ